MKPTYTKLQIDTAGQTELLEQTGDQTMIAKQGETSFAIRDQDGTATTAVDQKWHMISAEQVCDSGSVIWQHAETGTFRETKYSIDQNEKTWVQSGGPKEISIGDLYKLEGQHEQDLNQDGFVSNKTLNLAVPAELGGEQRELLIAGSSTKKGDFIGSWRADRISNYKITGKDSDSFSINQSGDLTVNAAKGLEAGKKYEIEITASDQTTGDIASTKVTIGKRALIMVKNNSGDEREHSLAWAIKKANEYGKKGIATNIEFASGMTIKRTGQLQLTNGDIKINTIDPKHISIKRIDKGPAIEVGEFRFAGVNLEKDQPHLKAVINQLSIFDTTTKGGNAVENGGSGGGAGAGSALLHYNGHLELKNILAQNNKVIGGKGTFAPKSGNGLHRAQEDDVENVWRAGYRDGRWPIEQASDGGPGLPGGTLNNRPHSMAGQSNPGGKKGQVHDGTWDVKKDRKQDGQHGRDGYASKVFGEAPMGPSAPGGGEHAHKNDFFGKNYEEANGKGGEGGNPVEGGWGTGESVRPHPGGHAWDAANGSARWTNNQLRMRDKHPNNRVKPGDWGGKAERIVPHIEPGEYSGQGAIPNPDLSKSGWGAAWGTISSVAEKNKRNSIKFDSVTLLANEASSSRTAGKFRGIAIKSLDAEINNVRESDKVKTIRSQRALINAGINETKYSINTDPDKTDKTKVHKHSGTFVQAEQKPWAPTFIRSNSYIVDENKANIVGKLYELNPNQPHAIFAGMQRRTDNTVSVEVQGSNAWRDGIFAMQDRLYSVKTEEEIEAGRKTAWDSFGGLISGYVSKIPGLSYFKDFLTAGNGIAEQFGQNARIERELQERKDTIQRHEANKAQFMQELATKPIQINDVRTHNTHNNFHFGLHTIHFDEGINPKLTYSNPVGVGPNKLATISITHGEDPEGTSDNSTKEFMRLKLNAEQTKGMENVTDKSGYFNQFITWQKNPGESVSAKLGTHTKWLTKTGNSYNESPNTGPGNDRVVIKRNQSGYVANNVNLIVHTYQGDDIIIGDQGNSEIDAGVGDDYIKPGLGVDVVQGGEGWDTVDYRDVKQQVGVIAHKNGEVKVNLGDPKENDKIMNVENFIFGENASIDFKDAARPVEYATTDPRRTTNKESHYAFSLQSNTSFEGSDYDDRVSINFDGKAGASNAFDLIKKVTIDGRGGRNTAIVKGLDPVLSQGYNLILDESKQELKLTNGSDSKTIVSYDNLMGGPKVYDKNDQEVELKSKASIAPSMDIDEELDLLTNYMASHEATTSASTRQLDTDQLILGTGGLAHSNAFESLTLEVTHQGVSLTQDPIKMILGDTSNSLEDGSNRHQQRDPLTQERIDNF